MKRGPKTKREKLEAQFVALALELGTVKCEALIADLRRQLLQGLP